MPPRIPANSASPSPGPARSSDQPTAHSVRPAGDLTHDASPIDVLDRRPARVPAASATATQPSAPPPQPTGVSLLKTGAAAPSSSVRILANGEIRTAEHHGPATPASRADALYRLARLIEDTTGNLFAPPRSDKQRQASARLFGTTQLGLEQKEKILAYLEESAALVRMGGELPAGLDALAAAQMRSSIATTLLHLMRSTPIDGDAAPLQARAFAAYAGMLQAESNPVLRDSMVFNLFFVREALAAEQQAVVDRLYRDIAPVRPPYDDWFKDGNRTLRVTWHSGVDIQRDCDTLVQAGFKLVREDLGRRILEIDEVTEGGDTKVVIEMKSSGGIFDGMEDPGTHVVVYSGHSGFGRSIRSGLEEAKPQQGAKVMFMHLCAGKDGLFRMREKYPDAHIVTTFDSSPANEGPDAFCSFLIDVDKRADWEAITRDMAPVSAYTDHALPFNFITPAHMLLRSRFLDSDRDGRADVVDRLVDFNLVAIPESTEQEFRPERSSLAVDKLEGTTVHAAAQALNTMVLYNATLAPHAAVGRVVSDGFFVPEPGEEGRIVRFSEDPDEKLTVEARTGLEFTALRMQVNAGFAHMSEAALRAVGAYELNRYLAEKHADRYPLGEIDGWSRESLVKLMGVVFAGAGLEIDMENREGRDAAIWDNLLDYAGLPSIDFRTLSSAYNEMNSIVHRDEREALRAGVASPVHDYTGSARFLKLFIEKLTPEQVRSLQEAG